MNLKFCTFVVQINMDILVQFHFDSCESLQGHGILSDFAAKLSVHSLEAVSVNCRSIVIFLVTFALRNDVHSIVAI